MLSSVSFPSTINSQPSTILPRPRPDRPLPRRLLNRFGGRIAEGEQDLFRAFRFVGFQFAQGFAEGVEAKVGLALGALHAVEKSGQLNESEPRIHEIEIEHLLACHKFCRLPHYKRFWAALNCSLAFVARFI